jgi:hypothetical protein
MPSIKTAESVSACLHFYPSIKDRALLSSTIQHLYHNRNFLIYWPKKGVVLKMGIIKNVQNKYFKRLVRKRKYLLCFKSDLSNHKSVELKIVKQLKQD